MENLNRLVVFDQRNFMRSRFIQLLIFLAGALLTGCVTVTPLTPDIAKESAFYGKLTPASAVELIRAKTSVSGEYADYNTFLLDEKGFSYAKTRRETRTKFVDGKPIKTDYTLTNTRNVPWGAVNGILPFLGKSQLGESYIVQLDFDVMTIQYARRVSSRLKIELRCRNYQNMTDVVAALRLLTKK
jgi:hypothetical protein